MVQTRTRVLASKTAAALDLPPVFRLVTLREAGNAFDHAKRIAAKEGAGTLVWVRRFDLVEFALVIEPDEPLRAARRTLYAGLAALADALAVHAPPERLIAFDWPATVFVEGAEVRSLLGSPTNGTMSIPLSTPLSVVIRRTGTAAFSFEVTDSPGVVALVLPQSYAPEWQLVGPGEIMYHGKANLYANLWLVQFTGSGSFVASYGLQRLAEDLPVATAGLAVLVFSVGLVLTIRKHRLERRKAQASVVGD